MSRVFKITLVAGALLLVAVAAIGGAAWYWIGQPLYQPGMVRAEQNLSAPLAPPPQAGDRAYWDVEPGIRLRHFSAGEGRPVLVIHGGPGNPYTQTWAGLEALTPHYVFHYYDQRGCGESTRPIQQLESGSYYENMQQLDRALGLGAQIADIERIRRILGEEKLILVGHSFGGFLAALYAAEFPERVEALILVSPADVLVMPQAEGGLFELVRERLPAERQADFDAYLQRYLDFQNIFQKSEPELAALNAEFGDYYSAVAPVPDMPLGQTGGWMVQAMYLSMGQRHDYEASLAVVTAPALVIHGAEDLQSERASRVYAEALPNSAFEILNGASHFSFEEQPEAFARLVGEFLASVKSAR